MRPQLLSGVLQLTKGNSSEGNSEEFRGIDWVCLWPEGRNPLGGILEASEWPTLFSRSVENGHPSPRLLKGRPKAAESLSGALRGSWKGFRDPFC